MLSKIFNFLTSISISSTLQSVVIFAFIFSMSHYANVEEYAEYRRVFYIIDFTTAFSLFGLNTLLLRKSRGALYHDILPSVLIINVLQLGVVTCFAFAQDLSLLKFIQITFFIVFNTLYQLCVSIIVLTNSRKLYSFCTFACLTISILGIYTLHQYNALTFRNIYILRLIILCIYIIPFLLHVGKRVFSLVVPSFSHIIKIFKEASPIGLGVMLGSCTLYIDKFIASLMNDRQLTIYANASADIPFVGIAITTMSIFFLPIIHKDFSQNKYNKVCENMSDLFLFGWYIGVTVFTLLFCNADFVIKILYSSRFAESVLLFRVFCLAYLFRIVSYTQIIVALELENIIIKRMFVEMILQLVLSYTLFMIWGPLGLAISVILVLALWSVPYNVINFKNTLKCSYGDILPMKKMLLFFIKAFIPCALLTIFLSYLDCSQLLILILNVIFYLIFNYKEIVYIITRVR